MSPFSGRPSWYARPSEVKFRLPVMVSAAARAARVRLAISKRSNPSKSSHNSTPRAPTVPGHVSPARGLPALRTSTPRTNTELLYLESPNDLGAGSSASILSPENLAEHSRASPRDYSDICPPPRPPQLPLTMMVPAAAPQLLPESASVKICGFRNTSPSHS